MTAEPDRAIVTDGEDAATFQSINRGYNTFRVGEEKVSGTVSRE